METLPWPKPKPPPKNLIEELPWNGIVALGLWCCEHATVFGGSAAFDAVCDSSGCDACAVCIGMFACHSAERKSLDIETGGTPLKYGLLSGRVGWRTKTGDIKRRGMALELNALAQVHGTAAYDKNEDDKPEESLNSQAICAGMRECDYVTPVDCIAKCNAKANVTPGDKPVRGQSFAEAAGFRSVLADRPPANLEGNCSASASHPDKWRAVAAPALKCSQNVHSAASGAETYDSQGGY